jgi:hypothetical protein
MTICLTPQTGGFIDFQVSENTAGKPWELDQCGSWLACDGIT